MDTTTALATVLSRRAAVLASMALALACLMLVAWLLPGLHISVAQTAQQGSWVVTLDWQRSCAAGPRARLLKASTRSLIRTRTT